MGKLLVYIVVLPVLILCAGLVGAEQIPPTGVSPGSEATFSLIGGLCPTFSWAAVSGAFAYELAVFESPAELAELATVVDGPNLDAENLTPVIRVRVPGAATSWTPSLAHCLEAGRRYVWFVRAAGKGKAGFWSEGLAFEVGSPFADVDLEEALERVVARARGRRGLDGAPRGVGPVVLPLVRLRPVLGGPMFAGEESTNDFTIGGVTAVSGELSETTGVIYGVRGVSNSVDPVSAGVAGEATAPRGNVVGVLGVSQSAAGAGVFGEAVSEEGDTSGVLGQTRSPDGAGVRGESLAASGGTVGVSGVTTSPEGVGVLGEAVAETPSATDFAIGVDGVSQSPTGIGVVGSAESATGLALGVVGTSMSPDGVGGLFINEGGGILLAANNEASPDAPEFVVDSTGTVILLPTDSPTPCVAELTGGLHFSASLSELCYCDGSGWKQVDSAADCAIEP